MVGSWVEIEGVELSEGRDGFVALWSNETLRFDWTEPIYTDGGEGEDGGDVCHASLGGIVAALLTSVMMNHRHY